MKQLIDNLAKVHERRIVSLRHVLMQESFKNEQFFLPATIAQRDVESNRQWTVWIERSGVRERLVKWANVPGTTWRAEGRPTRPNTSAAVAHPCRLALCRRPLATTTQRVFDHQHIDENGANMGEGPTRLAFLHTN